MFTRDRLNLNFYGRRVTSNELLRGHVEPPRAAEPLYRALDEHSLVGDTTGRPATTTVPAESAPI